MAQTLFEPIRLDDQLSILTDQIFREIGGRDSIVGARDRAEAIVRVEAVLTDFMMQSACAEKVDLVEDCLADIAFGQKDAEFLFAERGSPDRG